VFKVSEERNWLLQQEWDYPVYKLDKNSLFCKRYFFTKFKKEIEDSMGF
jgi:hypothetical protein